MSMKQEDWEEFRQVWGSAPMSVENQDQLRARVRNERTRMVVEAAGEAFFSIASMAVFLWWARHVHGIEKIILLTLSAASIVTLLVTTGFRRAVWRAKGESVAACRDLLRRQAVLGLVFARIGYIGGPIGVFSGVVLGQIGGVGASLEGPTDAVIAVSASVIFVAGWLWALREAGRRRRMIAELLDDGRP